MGSSQSVEIPGGGTEGYHVLRVRSPTTAWERRAGGGARPQGGRGPDGPLPGTARARPRRRTATAGAALAETGSGGLSHPAFPERSGPGVRRPGRTGWNLGDSRPLNRGAAQTWGARGQPFSPHGLLCPLSLNS